MHHRPDLKRVFEKLGVNTGTVTERELNSWWDNDESVVSILEFISSLGEGNVLTVDEKEWYAKNKGFDHYLSQEACQKALQGLELTHPGIRDLNALELEVECLENELQTLYEDEESLDNLLDMSKSIDFKLSKELDETADNIALISSTLSSLSKECLSVSTSLNDSRATLFNKVQRICHHVNEYECAVEPMHFVSMPHDWLKFNYDLFMNHCNFMLNKESLNNTVCSFIVETPLRNLCNSTVSRRRGNTSKLNTSILVPPNVQNELEILQKRIAKSIMGRIDSRIKAVESDIKLNTNSQLELMEFSRKFSPLKDSTWLNIPEPFANSVVKSDLSYMSDVQDYNKQKVEILMKQVNQLGEKMVESYTNFPRLYVSQVSLKNAKEKLNRLELLETYVTDFLNLYLFVSILYDIDLEEIHHIEVFFKDVLRYVNDDLTECKGRTDHMQKVINDFNAYKVIPLIEKLPILNTLVQLMSNENHEEPIVDFGDVAIAYNNFNKEIDTWQNRVFYKNLELWQEGLQSTLNGLDQIHNFLRSGPTNRFVILLPKLKKAFFYAQKAVAKRQSELQSATQAFSEAKNKIFKEKWFRFKRQLWIYFLTDPSKVVQIIAQLENHLKVALV